MSRWLAGFCLLFSLACGDDGGNSEDAAPSSTDSAVPFDADPSAPDADPGAADAMPGVPDANPVAGSFGPVDCVTTDDCLSPTTCTQSAPGGVCNGCGNASQCGADFSCFIGACVRDCQDDGDCSAGKRCTMGSGRCILRSCAVDPCPEPYACGTTNFCERPPCGANNSCTQGFTCHVASQICMEP